MLTLRLADARLLASSLGPRALLLGAPAGLEATLRAAGVDIVGDSPDLVIASNGEARRAAATGASAVVVLGPSSAALRRAGYATRSVLTRPGPTGPRLFVPVDAPGALASSLLARQPGRSTAKRFANRLAIAARRLGLPAAPVITVAGRPRAAPALLAAAAHVAGVELGRDWSLWLGEGDDLQRAVWVCFDTAGEASWAVKCSRVPGNTGPFVREEAAWRVLAGLPDALRRHVPQHLGRFEADRLPGAVESAARGVPLQDELEAGGGARLAVEAVADWIVAVGQATARPRDALVPELRRLAEALGGVAPPGLVESLPDIPAVLQHNDLGSWNVMVDASTFTVLDWESSREAGVPLWDLVYFLTDALAARPGQSDPAEKLASMLRLLRGESSASQQLFDRLAAAADAFGVPRDAVGAIVTLCWLQHGLSSAARAERGRAQSAATGPSSAAGPLERLAEPWLADPALGVAWPAFSRR